MSIDWTIGPRGWQGSVRARNSWRACVCALLFALLAGCAEEPAEERLRATLDAMQLAAVERRPADFMEHVAEDFVGNGNIDRAAMHNLLRAQLVRNASISATRGPTEVQLQGDRAIVKFKLVATGGSGGLLPERAQGYDITSGWRERDGDWELFSVEWKEAL